MSAGMAAEARAFREASDAQYADMVNNRKTPAEVIAANLTAEQSNVLDAETQLHAAIERGDKAEAERLLPILRSLVAAEAKAADDKAMSELAWRVLGDPAGQGWRWVGYGNDHRRVMQGIRAGIKLERDRAAQARIRPRETR